jgi:hypothetical protein
MSGRLGHDLRVVTGEDSQDVRAWLVDLLEQTRDVWRQHEQVTGRDVAGVPVGVWRLAPCQDRRAGLRLDLVVTKPEAERALDQASSSAWWMWSGAIQCVPTSAVHSTTTKSSSDDPRDPPASRSTNIDKE